MLDLRRRVAALEKALGPSGKTLMRTVVAGVGEALRGFRQEERVHVAAAIDTALDAKCALSYRGVHDATRAYARGDVTTHRGALWVALTTAAAGERPGTGSMAWRLIAKNQTEPTLRSLPIGPPSLGLRRSSLP